MTTKINLSRDMATPELAVASTQLKKIENHVEREVGNAIIQLLFNRDAAVKAVQTTRKNLDWSINSDTDYRAESIQSRLDDVRRAERIHSELEAKLDMLFSIWNA